MNVIKTAANGVVNSLTIFTFSQNESLVSVSYAGGAVRQGFLVGYFNGDKRFSVTDSCRLMAKLIMADLFANFHWMKTKNSC